MSDTFRILLLLALAGLAVTVLGSAAAWWRDEENRMGRMMRKALKGPADLSVIARTRGLAAGFKLDTGQLAVLWNGGGKGLIYRLDQIVGAELVVDDRVVARAFRGEPRRALDEVPDDARRVMLRLVFDNPRDPDFELPLWPPTDPDRVQRGTAFDAIQVARRWVSSIEAIHRNPPARPEPAARVDAMDAAMLAAPLLMVDNSDPHHHGGHGYVDDDGGDEDFDA